MLSSRFASAIDACERIQLELRGPDGKVIPTEYISIRDVERIAELGPAAAEEEEDVELTPEQQEAVDAMIRDWEESAAEREREGWRPEDETPFPRFQIYVALVDEWLVP